MRRSVTSLIPKSNIDDRSELVKGAKSGNSRLVDTRNKRTKAEREDDLVFITDLIVKECLSQQEIRERLIEKHGYSLSQVQVSNDVRELYSRWREAYLGNIDELRGRELKRIDKLEAAYWDSYERSLSQREVFKEEEEDIDNLGGSQNLPPGRTKRKRSIRELYDRDGSVAFLDGIKWCINQRCDILGLKAPVKSQLQLDWRVEAQRAGVDVSKTFNDLVQGFIDGNLVDSPMDLDEASLNKMINRELLTPGDEK